MLVAPEQNWRRFLGWEVKSFQEQVQLLSASTYAQGQDYIKYLRVYVEICKQHKFTDS